MPVQCSPNDCSHVALIAQLGEHCTGIAEVVGLNPAQSLKKFFSGLCSSSVTAALALMTVITQLLLWDKLLSCKRRRSLKMVKFYTVNSTTFHPFLGSKDYPPIIPKPTESFC